jgi:hypothetical protein
VFAIPIIDSVLQIGSKVIDKLIPDPTEKAKAHLELTKLAQEGEFKELELRMQAIITEAQSSSKLTSLARPMFMYVFYIVLLSVGFFAPIVGIFYPEHMMSFYTNIKIGFDAVPSVMWSTFIMGYLGYTGARTYEKSQIMKQGNI